jgi:hypothetical protein
VVVALSLLLAMQSKQHLVKMAVLACGAVASMAGAVMAALKNNMNSSRWARERY